MTHKNELRGFAHNIAYKFAISSEHFAYMAIHGASPEAHIDLLSRNIMQKEYQIERNNILVKHCVDNLLYLIKKVSVKVISAILDCKFEINYISNVNGYESVPVIF